MKIGLDYGGVISFAPDGWGQSIEKAKARGHQFYIVSHAREESGLQLRREFADRLGITDLSFGEFSQEQDIAQRKAELCQQHGIEIFIDDDMPRVEAVGRYCDRCAALYIPQNLWQIGQRLIDGLGDDW